MLIEGTCTLSEIARLVRGLLATDLPASGCTNAIFTTGRGLDGALRSALEAGANATGKTVVHLISVSNEGSEATPDRIAIGVPGGRRVHWYDDCVLWLEPTERKACIVTRGTKYACHFTIDVGLLIRHAGWPASSLRAGMTSARALLSRRPLSRFEPANDLVEPRARLAEAA